MLRKILLPILFSSGLLLGRRASGIYGYITSDTTWQDTVEVIGDIVIEKGATLIIKPGTVVRFLADTSAWDDTAGFKGRCDIIVYGNLRLRGTETDTITFTSTMESRGSWGGIRYCSPSRDTVEYVVLYYGMRALTFDSALNVSIQHCRMWELSGPHFKEGETGDITGIGIRLKGDSISIRSSVISSVSGGYDDVSYEFFIGGYAYGILCDSCSFLEISYDTIASIHGGASYGGEGGFPYLGGDATGISIQNGGNILIKGCLLEGCFGGEPEGRGYALKIEKGFAKIESNCIMENDVGIVLHSPGIIGGELSYANDIYDSLLCSYPDSVDARYNYWGTVDEIEIVAKTEVSRYSPWTDSLHKNLYYSSGIYGEIAGNMVWRGEVKIRGDIVIPRGTTLFIKPRTKIRFTPRSFWNVDTTGGTSKCDIFVYGNLKARGNILDTIQFGDTSLSGMGRLGFYESSDDTIKFCRLIADIYCGNASPCIDANEIFGRILLHHASPDISHNRIYASGCGIECLEGSSPYIFNNYISARGYDDHDPTPPDIGGDGIGIHIKSSSLVRIENNIINAYGGEGGEKGGDAFGILCSGDSCIIEGNTFAEIQGGFWGGNSWGIWIDGSGKPLINRNVLDKVWKGIVISGNSCPSIFSNRLHNIECRSNSNPLVGGDSGHCNIFIPSYGDYSLENYTPNNILASYNYWGTTTKDSISMLIFDHNDDPKYGYVIFEPFITDTTKKDTTKPDTSKSLPDSFAFYPLSPNPSLRICALSFSLPHPSSVNIEIFNITGRRVWSLFEPDLEKGEHQVLWDGKDEKERKLPMGIYFIRFKTGTYSKTQKVILLR